MKSNLIKMNREEQIQHEIDRLNSGELKNSTNMHLFSVYNEEVYEQDINSPEFKAEDFVKEIVTLHMTKDGWAERILI